MTYSTLINTLVQHPWWLALLGIAGIVVLLLPYRVAVTYRGRRIVYESPLVRYERGPAGWTLHLHGIVAAQQAIGALLGGLWRTGCGGLRAALLAVLDHWLRR